MEWRYGAFSQKCSCYRRGGGYCERRRLRRPRRRFRWQPGRLAEVSSKGSGNSWKSPGVLRDRLQISALEHVNQFFENPTLTYLQKVKKACLQQRCTVDDPDGGR